MLTDPYVRRRLLTAAGLLVALGLLAGACAPTPAEVQKVVETVVVTEEVVKEVVITPTPRPEGPKELIICQAQEPDTLYWYGGSMLAARHVQHALYDGPIDAASYSYQPIILEKLPSIEDGDAVVEEVEVRPGDTVLDVTGAVARWEEGVTVTNSAGEQVTFGGNPVRMNRIVATFRLLEGIMWEDGQPLTVNDSVFSFNLAAHPDTPVGKFGIERTASYEATDDRTAVWTGIPGWMDATYFINFWLPLPEHVIGDVAPADLLEHDYSRMPVGYGAFKMVEWVAGSHIIVERNPNYFRAAEGLPHIDRVTFKFIPDTNQLLAQLLSGECDIGTQDGMSLDQSPFLIQAEEQGILKPYFQTGTVWEHIDFNFDPVDARPAFGAFPEVRRAIALGTDRQAMVDSILYGRSKVQHSYIPEEHPRYPGESSAGPIALDAAVQNSIVEWPFDPDQARALLEEAGWVDSDGDGIREAAQTKTITILVPTFGEGGTYQGNVEKTVTIPAGTRLSMTLNTTSGNRMREQITQAFQANMRDIGMEIQIELLPASVYFADGPDGPLFGRRFDLGEFAWLTGVEPPGELYICSQVPGPDNAWGGQNQTSYCNPEYDEWVQRALGTLVEEEQIDFWAKAQFLFSRDLPVMPLFARIKVAATRPEVANFVIDPTENSEISLIEEFDLR